MPDTLPRRLLQKLPDSWRAALAGIAAKPVTTGMSGAEVFRLRTKPLSYLKFADGEAGPGLRQELARTIWLADRRIRVAPILRSHDNGRAIAILSQALPGQPADRCGVPVARLLRALGRALSGLHALPAANCPFDESLAVRLGRAQEAVEQGEVDARHFATRNRKVSPRDLFARVAANPPMEEIVVAHGDASLSNMIVDPDGAVGFVDCGHAGRADRYLDLGVVAAEIADHFGRRYVRSFVEAYGLPAWDKHKAAYYADLYEFF